MSDLIPMDAPVFEERARVAELFLKGKDPTKIAKELGLRRMDVVVHIDDIKNTAAFSEVVQQRTEEVVKQSDMQYTLLIGKFHEIADGIDEGLSAQWAAQKINALTKVMDAEKQRVEMYRQLGFLQGAEQGDRIVHLEDRLRILIKIMQENLCVHCKPKVLGLYSEATGEVHPVEVYNVE